LESESKTKERWQLLCQQAAAEQDPDRFLAIIQELQVELERRKKPNNVQHIANGGRSTQKLP
jgi:hypothetical protein